MCMLLQSKRVYYVWGGGGNYYVIKLLVLCCFILLDYDIANLVYHLLTKFNKCMIHFYGVVSN